MYISVRDATQQARSNYLHYLKFQIFADRSFYYLLLAMFMCPGCNVGTPMEWCARDVLHLTVLPVPISRRETIEKWG